MKITARSAGETNRGGNQREAGKPAASVIDTSKMSAGKREALELAEASRDPLDERGSFASNLFIGRYDFDRIFPYPEQSAEDRAAGEAFPDRTARISRAKTSTPTRSIAPARFRRRTSTTFSRWALSGSKSRSNTAASDCRR